MSGMKRIPTRNLGILETPNTEKVQQREVSLESQVKKERNLHHFKEMWQRLSCFAETLGLKKKEKERDCEGERHVPSFCPKLGISYKADN